MTMGRFRNILAHHSLRTFPQSCIVRPSRNAHSYHRPRTLFFDQVELTKTRRVCLVINFGQRKIQKPGHIRFRRQQTGHSARNVWPFGEQNKQRNLPYTGMMLYGLISSVANAIFSGTISVLQTCETKTLA